MSDLPTYTYRLKYSTIAGYLPAPKADGTKVAIADCHHEDITPEPEPAPDLVASLFGASVVVADPEPEPKPAPKPVKKQTARKNTKPSKTLKFPFAKDLIIDGENVGKCTEIQEFAKAYSFITYNGVFQCTKTDKIQSNGFEIRVTTTK